MSGNVSIHGVSSTDTLTNGKVKWIPIKVNEDGELLINIASGEFVDTTNNFALVELRNPNYETVAASQTDQVLGATGAVGDFIHRLICIITTSTGTAVSIKDGSGSSIPVLPTGISAPNYFNIELNATSTSGAWSVTTGANVVVLAIGRFTA